MLCKGTQHAADFGSAIGNMHYDVLCPEKMNLLRQFRSAPNLLTLSRLFIVPYLVIEILDERYRWAFALFLIAGFSDSLDGLLARALHQKTKLGQYLDPIADKLLLSTLFLVLTHMGLVPRYATVLVFSRDVGILTISTLLYVTNTLRDFRPSLLGKLNTLVQIVGVTTVLVMQVWDIPGAVGWRRFLMHAIAVLAPASAAHYAWSVLRRVQTGAQQAE